MLSEKQLRGGRRRPGESAQRSGSDRGRDWAVPALSVFEGLTSRQSRQVPGSSSVSSWD